MSVRRIVGMTVLAAVCTASGAARPGYAKGSNWVETVCAHFAQGRSPHEAESLVPRLLADFPADRRDIVLGCLSERPATNDLVSVSRWTRALGVRTNGTETSATLVAAIRDRARMNQTYRRSRALVKYFDPVALERAIGFCAAKWPDRFDRKALLAELKPLADAVRLAKAKGAFGDTALADRLDAFNRKVFLRHPALDFREILFVRRAHAYRYDGLPSNWQGNSSVPLFGYDTEILRAPLAGDGRTNDCASVYRSGPDNRFAFAGDVRLDYDAKRILFSSGDTSAWNWGVFETDLARPGVRTRLTPGATCPDVDYYDACYLPDGRHLLVASSGFQGVPCVSGSDSVGNLHIRERDGSFRRLTFDQDNCWYPTVNEAGRVIYLRWEYTDSAHYFSRVLMTMNPDGTDQQEYYGSNSYWPNSLFYARNLPGSTSAFVGVVSGHHGQRREGDLVVFDVSRGRKETAGVVQRIPGWGEPVANVTRDQLVSQHDTYFLHPFPLGDGLFLASVRANDGWSRRMICLVDVYDNIVPLRFDADGSDLLEPIPLRPTARPKPQRDRVEPGKKTCTVLLTDVNRGPGLKGVPPGTVKKLRVFQYDYSPRRFGGHYEVGFEGPWDLHIPLGEVDVESDGSALFVVPANTPISVQPLDANGCALQLMRSWFTGMPGERLSCIGCHEMQNAAVAPMGRPLATLRPPQEVRPWYGPRRGFSFEREVQPVLDAKCISCHHAGTPLKTRRCKPLPDFATSRLALDAKDAVRGTYSVSYLNLHPYVRRNGPEGDYHMLTPLEFHADTSELFQMLRKGHHGVTLTKEELDRLQTWVDLNVPYWGTWTELITCKRGAKGMEPFAAQLKRRREMAKAYAGVEYDPEVIVNPYVRPSHPSPRRETGPADARRVVKADGWPFDANAAKRLLQERRPESVYMLGEFVEMRFAYIPAGRFVMGSEDETPAEAPAHVAEVKRPFRMGVTEVSVKQFRCFDPTFEDGVYDMHYKDQVKRGYYMEDERFPAVRVSWERAQAFCRWLSAKIGRTVRLPTETEWEWACRAGTDTPFNFGRLGGDFAPHANLADASFVQLAVRGVDPKPIPNPSPLYDYELRERAVNDGVLHLAPVGSYRPNAWGLFDMHGNAAEWTASDWTANHAVAPASDELKVVRGGSWYRRPERATSSWRWRYPRWMAPFDVGFRVVIEEGTHL